MTNQSLFKAMPKILGHIFILLLVTLITTHQFQEFDHFVFYTLRAANIQGIDISFVGILLLGYSSLAFYASLIITTAQRGITVWNTIKIAFYTLMMLLAVFYIGIFNLFQLWVFSRRYLSQTLLVVVATTGIIFIPSAIAFYRKRQGTIT